MPYSHSVYKKEVFEHFLMFVARNSKILDGGAGCGTYSKLLKEHFPNMDGLEIHEPYSRMFNLKELYDNLFITDIRDFDISQYDYIILGDIIEHLSVPDAQALLNKIKEADQLCMVAVPYNFHQGEEYGNVHETHLQPDLTEEIFLQRYPMMKLLFGNQFYGYFINYEYN